MKKFEVEVGAWITIEVGSAMKITANSEEEAIKKAKARLEEEIAENYPGAGYDSCDLTCDYIAEV